MTTGKALHILLVIIPKELIKFTLKTLMICSLIASPFVGHYYYTKDKLTFRVFGEEELLKNSKVTVVSYSHKKAYHRMIEPLLFLGAHYEKKIIPALYALRTDNTPLRIFVSYKDELVGIMELGDLWYKMYNQEISVNHIYLTREGIHIKAYYDTTEKEKSKYVGIVNNATYLIPKEEFYQKHNLSSDDISKYELLFFNAFPTHIKRPKIWAKDLETKLDNSPDNSK